MAALRRPSQALTYASLLTLRDDQRMARVNLHPAGWHSTGDRESFLTAARPQVVTGSALSLLGPPGSPSTSTR